ncbi:MAG: hypothetical protein L0387_39310 [Acidobacteria bacterium]|nr:hypothetical protein [Acidobacteriota bacterium]
MQRKRDLPSRFTSQSWARQKRLEFIDFHVFWEGEVTKPRIKRYFDASENTIRKDFIIYIDDLKGRMHLDEQRKRYVASPGFEPLIIEPDANDYLYFLAKGANALDLVLNHADRVEGDEMFYFPPLIVRQRIIDPYCLRTLLDVIRSNLSAYEFNTRRAKSPSVERQPCTELCITYESPNQPRPEMFWITPHALIHDGFRWSTRAHRYDYDRFGELVLDRIVGTGETRPSQAHGREEDDAWHREFSVLIGPNPKLDAPAREHIEVQYGMRGGEIAVPVKECAIVYFLKRYQIEEESLKKAPHQEPIVVLNRPEVTQRIPPRMQIPPED